MCCDAIDKDVLMTSLLSDLSCIGIPVNEVDMSFRPYSKTYYGRYFPSVNDRVIRPRIFIYPYEKDGSFMDYFIIFENAVHEFCHHIQYSDSSFIRRKGIMHNAQFYRLYNHYMKRAYHRGIIEKERLCLV